MPTETQWDRAAAGDTLDQFGIATLTAAWLECHYGARADDLCTAISGAVSNDPKACACPVFGLTHAGANAWDVGPFGHMDLYGNAEEWVRWLSIDIRDAAFCELPNYSSDPASYLPEWQGNSFVRQLANMLYAPSISRCGSRLELS